jgi:DNA-binding response OmpR family regulator
VLVILDLMLPGLDGRTVCRRLRAETDTPVVMLTARTTEDDRVTGLESGADDYVTKPFSPRELVARVRAVLRRRNPEAVERRRRWGPLSVDLDSCEARRGELAVPLTATERRLLFTLLGAPGRVFSRDELIARVLGADFDGSARTIDAHVRNLRTKIEVDPARPRFVRTVFGAGYRLGDASDAVSADAPDDARGGTP